jgi:hypothetical protein
MTSIAVGDRSGDLSPADFLTKLLSYRLTAELYFGIVSLVS